MTDDYGAKFPANAGQAEFWNSTNAEKWVASQDRLDGAFGGLSEILIARAAPADGEQVLEIGCGAGTLSLLLSQRVGAKGGVLGADISAVMLAAAETRRQAAGAENVRYENADAQTHDFGAATFDLIFSRFGVMFFADPYAAFANLFGALKPGGRLLFACWLAYADNPWFQVPLEAAVAELGPPDPAPPRAPGPTAFAEEDYVRDILEKAGFVEIAHEELNFPMTSGKDAAEAARFACEVGPAARLIRQYDADADAVVRIVAGIEEGLRPYETPDGMAVPSRVWLVSAKHP